MTKKHKFNTLEQEFHVDFDINFDDVEFMILTNGGKEFTAHYFKEMINQYEYFQERIALESSQNGMAKQLHHTLKERM